MNIGAALRFAEERLKGKGVPDARLDAELLLSETLGLPRLDLLLQRGEPLGAREAAAFEGLLGRRARREPLQYIVGRQDFMGHSFRVSPGVLIPRQDTETLCLEALARLRGGEEVLDLCTGSGAVAVSLALARPDLKVTASDLSGAALETARENARRLGAPVRFVQGDLLEPFRGERFGMIVCNPPYVPSGEMGSLQKEVLAEPRMALDGGKDGLLFYRRLFDGAPGHLFPGAWLLCELGDGLQEAAAALAGRRFTGVVIRADLGGLPRVLAARLKG